MSEIENAASTPLSKIQGLRAGVFKMCEQELADLEHMVKKQGEALKQAEWLAQSNAKQVEFYKNRDVDKQLAAAEQRIAEITTLKDSYLNNIDAAMKCVEAVLVKIDMSKDEIEGRGAEFFTDAAKKVPKAITRFVDERRQVSFNSAVMTSKAEVERAVEERATAVKERNVAVRKQLDHEVTIRQLTRDLENARNFAGSSSLAAKSQRVSELTVALDKAMKQASDAQERVDVQGCKLRAAEQRCADIERVMGADIQRLGDENAKLSKRITYLTSISPGADSDSVTKLINECGHLLTPSVADDRVQAVQGVIGLALQFVHKNKEWETAFAANERYTKWLDAVGRHLQLTPSRWWEQHDAVERLRTRVEWLRDGNTKAIAALTAEVERLTDVIHELRKET